jgi:hypothetical protein
MTELENQSLADDHHDAEPSDQGYGTEPYGDGGSFAAAGE